MRNEADNVAFVVYGGSFDPPHAGHRDCVRLALGAFPKATVLVVPGFQAAGALGQHKVAAATFDQRVAMCELAFSGLPRLEVSRLEGELPAPNYTLNTLTKLASTGKAPLALLIGQDQLESFLGWRAPRKILELASLALVERPATSAAPSERVSLRPNVDELLARLGLSATWHAEHAEIHATGTSIHLIGRSAWPAASRDVRADYAAGIAPPSGWLAPGVDSYIRTQALYGT